MAQLALAAGGAILGSFFGAPGLGWAAGALAGGLLFPAKPKNSQAQILDNTINNATYGQPIPYVAGTAKVGAANRIWQAKFRVVSQTQSAKGFGGPSQTTQTVFGSCAWGVCQGPVKGFGRIWANGNLIVNPAGSVKVSALSISSAGSGGRPGPAQVMGTTGNGAPHYVVNVTIGGGGGISAVGSIVNAGYYTSAPSSPDPVQDISGSGLTGATLNMTTVALPAGKFNKYFTYYLGTEDQLPDPTMEAVKSAGNVPAYRGTAYIVATNMPLAAFGNGYPSLEVEVNGFQGSGSGGSVFGTTWGSDHGADVAISTDKLTATNNSASAVLESVLTDLPIPPGAKYYVEFSAPFGSVGGYGPIGPFNPPYADIHSIFSNNSFGYSSDGSVGKGVTPPPGWPVGGGSEGGYGLIDPYISGVDSIGMAIDGTGSDWKFALRVIHSGTPKAWNDSDDVGLPCDPTAGTGMFTGGATHAGGVPVPFWLAASIFQGTGCTINFGPTFLATPPAGYVPPPHTLTLADLVQDICERSGLADSDIDVSALATQAVRGVCFARQMSGKQMIQAAMQDYFFTGVPEDDLLRFKFRGGASALTITESDLAADSSDTEGKEPKPQVKETIRDDMDLPQQVYFTYVDVDLEYQEGAQVSPRRAATMSSRDLQQVDSVFVHDRNEALAIAAVTNALQWNGRTDYEFALPLRYRKLSPGDVVTAVYKGGTVTNDVELTGVNFGADLVLDFTGISADAPSFTAAPSPGPGNTNPGQDVPEDEPTTLQMLDLPLLAAGDDSMGYYAAAHGTDLKWPGAPVMKSTDDVNFAQVGDAPVPAITGLTTTVLANVRTWAWDRTSTVRVQLDESDESLASVAEADVLNEKNIFMVGSEMIGAATVTLISPGLYELSDLIRGLQGTDWASSTHAIGEDVVLLGRDGSIVSLAAPLSEFGVLRYFRAPTRGELVTTATDVDLTPAAIRIKPISPFVDPAKASRDGSNNLTQPFTPRSRLAAGWYTSAPDESQGIFRADVIHPALTVARTITSVASANGSVISQVDASTWEVVYQAADQVLDGITPGASVTLDVYQMSARINALGGYKTEVTA